MRGQWKNGWRAVAVLLAAATVGLAQQTNTAGPADYPGAEQPGTRQPNIGLVDSRTGRTASPGAINYVEGQATLDGQRLSRQSVGSAVAGPNQVINTGDGYVEVLLTPGAFLRVGHNSAIRLIRAGLTGVDLQLDHGSAMIEVADLVKGSDLEVAINGATTRIEHKGLYAFDADQRSVRVLDGKAEVLANAGETTLKKGNEVILAADTRLASNTPLKKRDFEVKAAETEPLYVWSKVRGEDESEANALVANRIAASGGWSGPGWYWDPLWSNYAFLPGAGMFYSPFGWGYYSPGFASLAPWGYGYGYRGYYGHGFYGRGAYVGGVRTGVRSFSSGGFHGGGSFHGGGGFHGGGHR